jgi:FMN reductase (NADPH)/FMN reductase [NAD(P)H]
MNETLAVIDRRRSTRAYSDQPLSEAEKDAILHAVLRAPTAGNMMLYTILEIEDPALKARLAETCDHQPFIAKAPFVLLFAADYQRWYDYYCLSGAEQKCRELGRAWRTPSSGDLLLACCDALIAAQNAVIAAESLGISSCYIGDILERYETHRDLLGLTRYVVPVTLLCFGRPLRQPEGPSPVSRFDREFIVHKNTYRRLDAPDLLRMFEPAQEKRESAYLPGAENYGQHQYLRKFGADFSIEMSRSVREMLKSWGEEENGE